MVSAKKICSICEEPYDEWGNNAWPINSGQCCDLCDRVYVIPARLNEYVSATVRLRIAELRRSRAVGKTPMTPEEAQAALEQLGVPCSICGQTPDKHDDEACRREYDDQEVK